MKRYKDADANETLIRYALENSYFLRGYSGNACIWDIRDSASLALQFAFVQSIRPDVNVKLHHFVLGLDDVSIDDQQVDQIARITLDYFVRRNYQVVIAYHWRSATNPMHRHFHVLVNNVSVSGGVFHGTDTQYGELLSILRTHTPYHWSLIWREDES